MRATLRLLSILFVLIFFGCGKESVVDNGGDTPDQPDSGDTYNPTGNLVVYVDSLGIMPFTVGSDTLCSHLCFAVYDMDGRRVRQTNQKASDSHYGAMGMQLDADEYQLVALAHSGSKNPTMTNPARIQFNSSTGYSDTYLYYAIVDITTAQQKLHVGLRRITALCRFVVGDTIPDSIAQLRFTYTGGSAHFDAASGIGVTASTQTVTYDVQPGAGCTQHDLYTIPFGIDEDTLALTVMALTTEGTPAIQRQFDVPVRCDQLTWLIGSFFDASQDTWTFLPDLDFTSRWPREIYLSY